MMTSRTRKAETGSATLGYALVMPLLLLIVLTGFQCILLMHDQALLQAVVTEAATTCANNRMTIVQAQPPSKGDDMAGAEVRRDMYWQLKMATRSDAGTRDAFSRILFQELCSSDGFSGFALQNLNPEEMEISVRTGGGIPFGVMRVSVSAPISGPIGAWTAHVKNRDGFRMHADTEVLVTSPDAFLQDVDWGLQLLKGTDAGKGMEQVVGAIRNWGMEGIH